MPQIRGRSKSINNRYKEILKSNIQVAKIILTKTPESKIAIIKNYNTKFF